MEQSNGGLRASSWDEYIGQTAMKERLSLYVEAARNEDALLPHMLLAGPAGFGKTTLARIMSKEVGDDCLEIPWPIKPNALASALRAWDGGVLLVDEVHRGSQSQQEDLLTILTEGYFQTASGRKVYVHCTVIACTTERHGVITPLLSRFPVQPRFADYTEDELGRIVQDMAFRAGLGLDDLLCRKLGKATGGTPRMAEGLVIAARTLSSASRDLDFKSILDLAGVDESGVTHDHSAYLKVLADIGGVGGLNKIAGMLDLHEGVVTGLERLLVKQGLIVFGERGRELTPDGFRKVNGSRPRRTRAVPA